jgi:superfamily I DNA and/or RNA helicase
VSNAVGNCKNRTQIAALINSVPIIVGTLSSLTSAVSLFRLRRFDTAIIDEASQILEPQILPLLTEHYSDGTCAVGKFVMIGDHKQLPAVVVQPKRKSIVHSPLLNGIGLTDCSNSLFERLCNYCKSLPQHVGMLDHQGRMHPQIGVYAAMQFYEGQLVPVPTSHQKESLPYKKYSEEEMIVATRRLAFIDVPLPKAGEWIPKSNIKEAELIVNVVRMLMNVSEKNGVDFVPSEHLGIIVPFRRQITTVRRLLHECGVPKYESIMIDTVERYQGSQRDIILYGTTIAQPYELSMLSSPVEVGGTLVDRKLNVAVTRARKQLFVFGNRNLLMQNPLYASLIDYCGSAYA